MPRIRRLKSSIASRLLSRSYQVWLALCALATASLEFMPNVIAFLPTAREYISTPVARAVALTVICCSVIGFVLREITKTPIGTQAPPEPPDPRRKAVRVRASRKAA